MVLANAMVDGLSVLKISGGLSAHFTCVEEINSATASIMSLFSFLQFGCT